MIAVPHLRAHDMKQTALVVLALAAGLPALAADVGVSISIAQPGVYGRIDIGRFPQPVLISPQPVIVAAAPRPWPHPEPVYLWVPPGHQRHWSKHCAKYRACGAPVVFVQERWYQDHVMRDHPRGKHAHKHRRD